MGAAAFLLVVVVLSVVGSLVLVLRHRDPGGDSIDAFRQEMDALAPPDHRRQK
jgi:hypothetical protein